MKALLFSLTLLLPGGDRDRGLALYEAGRFPEAAEAFLQAIATEGDSAELSYNLALALWRAGDRDGAETAAERAATLSDGNLASLRDGVLGNLRYQVARETEAEDLPGALELAEKARDHYLRGSLKNGTPELHRNLERALDLVDELKQKLEEQQQEQQPDQDPQPQEEEQQEEEQQQDQQQQEQQEQQEEEKQEEEQQQQEEEQREQEQQLEDQQLERNDAPGESEPTQLTPEQKQRLMEQLSEMEDALRQLRAMQQAARPKVERDW